MQKRETLNHNDKYVVFFEYDVEEENDDQLSGDTESAED